MFKLNKNNIFFFLLILLTFKEPLLSQVNNNRQFRTIKNNAFGLGEKLVFDLKYGFVKAGIAEMSVPAIRKINGREVYLIRFFVRSTPTFDLFYKVRDNYSTYLDTAGLFPWRFEQHIREGKYKRDYAAFFDQKKHIAITSEGIFKMPEYVNDIISAFYFFRTFDFTNRKKGDTLSLQNFYKNKVYPLDVLFLGKTTVEVEAGKFKCILLEPIILKGGLFKSTGNILIWLTDDERKMPVKVQTKIIIGSVVAELRYYSGIKGEIKAKLNEP